MRPAAPGQAVVPVSMYISFGYGEAEASMTVPGTIARREIRTSIGPGGMSRTTPLTNGTKAMPDSSNGGAVATHSPAVGVASWAWTVGEAPATIAAPAPLMTTRPITVRRLTACRAG